VQVLLQNFQVIKQIVGYSNVRTLKAYTFDVLA